MQGNALTSLKWLLSVSGTQRQQLCIAMLFTTLQVTCSLIPPVVIYFIVDGLTENTLYYQAGMQLALLAVGATLLRYGLFFAAALLSHHAAFQLVGAIKSQLSKRLLKLPMAFFNRHRSTDLRQVIHEDVDRMELFVAHHITDLWAAIITPVLTAGVLFYFDWRLTLVALLPLPVAIMMQSVLFRGFEQKAAEYYKNLAEMNHQASQLIRGVAALRMLTGSNGGMSPLLKSIKSYSTVVEHWMKGASLPFSLLKVCLDISLVTLLPVAAWFTLDGNISTAGFILFMMLGLSLTEPFYNLLMFTGFLNQILQGIERIQQLETTQAIAFGNLPWPQRTPTITVNNLRFRFAGRHTNALKDISVMIQPGEKIAVIGASGSGKSTFIKLLAGFYPEYQGSICFDAHQPADYQEIEFYCHLGIVMQHNHIIDGTVRDNIAMGKAVNDEQIWQVLARSEARQFIADKPYQLDTQLGGHSTRLSGGEQQRIAIARALIKNANIYLFDEATSFFDPKIEAKLLNRLLSELTDETLVFVTHRLNMAQRADKIMVMKHGELVGFGSHRELMAQCNEYRSLNQLTTNDQTPNNPPLMTTEADNA